MKRLNLSRLASVLAMAMLLSVVLPLVVSAASLFEDLHYENGKLTGKLLTTETVGNAVYQTVSVDVYTDGTDPAHFYNVTEATYLDRVEREGTDYNVYDFEITVSQSVYESVYLRYADQLHKFDLPDSSNGSGGGGSGGGGGGGIGWIPSGGDVDGTVIKIDGGKSVSADALLKAFENGNRITILIDGDTVLLPAAALKEAMDIAGATIHIVSDHGTYTLPLSVLDVDDLAEQLEVDLEEVSIKVEIVKVNDSTARAILNRVEQLGGEQVADAIHFKLSAVDEDDHQVSIHSFGNTYVERSIPLHHSVNTDQTTGVVYDPDANELYFVPSVFRTDEDETDVILKRNSNSIYTAITLDKSFGDVPAGHWAEEDIHVLANKLVVHGVSDTTFDLDRDITRAEFAALVVRSLGLRTNGGTSNFSDVAASAWYAEEVGIAVEAGLVYGYEDGTFRPNHVITREELAALVVRAYEYAGHGISVSNAERNQLLSGFRDADQIGWGHEELAQAIKAGIVHGMGEDILAPKGNATRAQATAMLYRYLQGVDFID